MPKSKLNYKKVKKTIQRKKTPRYPANPKSLAQFKEDILKPNVMSNYGYTTDGDFRFYMDTVLTKDYDFTVFFSQYTIEFINKNIPPGTRRYILDGTFDKIPKGFYQLLVIAIEFQNDVSISTILV